MTAATGPSEVSPNRREATGEECTDGDVRSGQKLTTAEAYRSFMTYLLADSSRGAGSLVSGVRRGPPGSLFSLCQQGNPRGRARQPRGWSPPEGSGPGPLPCGAAPCP